MNRKPIAIVAVAFVALLVVVAVASMQGLLGPGRVAAPWARVAIQAGVIAAIGAVAIVGIRRALSERERADEQERRSEQEYRALFENTSTAMIIVEEDTTISLANKGFARLSGFPRHEVEGKKSWMEFVAKEDLDRMREYHKARRMDREEARTSYELRFVDRYGQQKDILLTIDMLPGGKRSLASLDIPERKQAEQRVRESEERYRTLVDNANEMIAVIQDGMVRYANPRALEASGYSREEVTNKPFIEFIHPEDRPMVAERYRKRTQGDEVPSRYEFRFVDKNGAARWVNLSAARIAWDGQPATLNLLTDVTERKKAEAELQARNYELGERVKELGCLYEVAELAARPEIELDELLRSAVTRLPGPWQYPDITCARVMLDGRELSSPNFRATRWRLSRDITVGGEVRGMLEVCYLEERPSAYEGPFLKEERDLIDAVARLLANAIERKRAEENVAQAYEIINRSGIVVFLWRNEEGWPVEYVSHNVEDLTGYTDAEFTSGKVPYREVIHADDLDRVAGEVATYSQDGERSRFEHEPYRIITKDGTEKWVRERSEIRRDHTGRITHYQGIVEDVTGRRHTEEQLALRAQLLDTATDSIFLHDLEGNMLYVNETACRAHGYSCDELLNMKVAQLDTPEYREKIRPRVKEILEKGESSFESAHLRKDGSVLPVELHTRLVEADGRSLILSVARDITERKQAEEEVQDSLDRVRKARDGVIQAISHTLDLRDPYTGGHQQRVTQLATAIAGEMGLSDDEQESIRVTGMLHDIGKISVPAELLTKPGRLTDIEFSMIKQHPDTGYEITKEVDFAWPVADIIRQHHERLDGTGYPQGLEGDQIMREARVLAVADVVEAMASHRPYRPAKGLDCALNEVTSQAGQKYDQDVVDACVRLFREKDFAGQWQEASET